MKSKLENMELLKGGYIYRKAWVQQEYPNESDDFVRGYLHGDYFNFKLHSRATNDEWLAGYHASKLVRLLSGEPDVPEDA